MKPEPPADLWDALANALNELRECDPRPAGAFTAGEYASRFKLSERRALEHLKQLTEAGKVAVVGRGKRGQRFYVLA